MNSFRSKNLFALVCLAATATQAGAQTNITAANLALRSSGTASGNDVTLSTNGYLGTYVTLASPGTVTFDLQALGVATPHLNIVVDDSKAGFDVGTSVGTYSSNVSLPAGTHFVRLEYTNDSPAAATRTLTLRNLQVTGATVSNLPTDANALAASNTYIDNFRKGNVSVALTGPGGVPLLPGTPVHSKMVRNAFNFGGTVSGSSNNDSKDMLASNPAAGTEAYKFQQFINANFNTIVPSNGGKWANNEATQNSVNMTLPDKQLAYAASHHMRARMHNLIWGNGPTGGNQQPTWVNTLISSAAGGNATAKANLLTAINNRSAYYAGPTANRASKYIEVDGLNESLHNPSYWNIYGAAGVATIYNQLASQIAAGGGNAKIYLNEWNVLQYSPLTVSNTGAGNGADPYANWYRQNVEDVVNAGGAVGGIGVQYYASATQTGSFAHSTNVIQQALQNLDVENLPITMAEFGLASGTTKADSQSLGPKVLEDTMRMFYGNPQATTFMIWGWWDTSTSAYPPAALLDNSNGNNSLTPMGTKWAALMAAWCTDVTPSVDANGNLAFKGYWGDYNLGDSTSWSNLTLNKGTNNYALQLTAPPTWSLWNATLSGNWSTAGNWTTGGIASGAGTTAYFGTATANRIITVESPFTVGQLVFDSAAGSYQIAGDNLLTLHGLAGVSAIYVTAGSHRIDDKVLLTDDTRISVGPAASLLTLTQLQNSPGATITKLGLGTLAVDHVNAASLTINAGTVQTTVSTSVVHSLAIDPSATLDVTSTSWIVNYTGASPLNSLRNAIQVGDITSSTNPDPARDAIGYGEASPLNLNTFGGVSFTGDAVVLRLTQRGDTNLDGVVNFDDLLRLAQSYETGPGKLWTDGDSNGDGVVDFNDLLLLSQNYSNGIAGEWSQALLLVPEPVSFVLPLIGLALSSRAPRRSQREGEREVAKKKTCR